jgi:hypothetical protein
MATPQDAELFDLEEIERPPLALLNDDDVVALS